MRHERDEFDILHWVIVIGTIGLVIAGLIEFNARRQAAAMTRELLRPATAEERAQIDAMTQEMDAAMTREMAAIPTPTVHTVRYAPAPTRSLARYDSRPLATNERCIQHQRFRRESNGWTEIGTCN